MKKLIFLVLLGIFTHSHLKAQKNYAGIKLGYHTHRVAEIGIGYARIPQKTFDETIPIWIYSPTIGMEFVHNSSRNIFAPKMSVEAHYVLGGARLNLIVYPKESEIDIRLRPEAGFSFFGLCNVFYGYNIPLSNDRLPEVQPHRVSLIVNLPIFNF